MSRKPSDHTQPLYIGTRIWYYKLPGGIELQIDIAGCSSNRQDDEQMARHLIRERLGVNKLPIGTKVWPHESGLSQQRKQ
jgi:hypothetical protein